GLVRRLRAPVLPDLPDRRQAPRRPPPLPPAQVDPLSRTARGARGHDRSPTAAAPAGTLRRNLGAIAQLEEHLLCKQGVRGSSPLSSTDRPTETSVSPRWLLPAAALPVCGTDRHVLPGSWPVRPSTVHLTASPPRPRRGKGRRGRFHLESCGIWMPH